MLSISFWKDGEGNLLAKGDPNSSMLMKHNKQGQGWLEEKGRRDERVTGWKQGE